ncbi:MAG TPA: metallophosphoesterase [Candidatus Acidoferrum sp.]|nr:metallophosphoesterase [Candidatus Acidoferrum sp.]
MQKLVTRRTMLRSLAAAGCGGLALGLYTWRVEPHWLEFTYPDLPIKDLPRELEGKTLAQISDLHVGPKVDDEYVLQSFRRAERLAPDITAFTGDWITYRGQSQFEQLRRLLANIPHGRLGTVGILGNHDYGRNWRMVDVAEQVATIARAAGVKLLRNESVIIAGLQFLGLDDLWSPCFDPARLLAERGREGASLVLCHNPDAADLPVWGEYQGWILAGHTHGGQCKPPFLPPPLLPVKNKRYTSGEFELSGTRRMYISRGVGHLIRVRFNVRPEIPVFRLKRA